MVAFEQFGGFANGSALPHQAFPQGDLIGGELGRSTEANPPRLRCYPAAAGALVDQLALELGDAGEHRQHHAACG